jgi:thioesterase domain-containing protein
MSRALVKDLNRHGVRKVGEGRFAINKTNESNCFSEVERKALTANASPRSKIVLVQLNERLNEQQPIIYLVHDLSCSANTYIPLARAAAGSLHVVGVQAPQSLMKRCEQSKSEFPASLAELASLYVSEVINYQPNGSIILGGWSLGAVVALEMAEQLAARGRKVRLLVPIDGAPENTLTGMKKTTPSYYVDLLTNFIRSVRRRDMKTLLSSVYYKTRMLTKTAQRQHPAVKTFASYEQYLPHMQTFVRKLYDIVDTYKPESDYSAPVIVFEAEEQPLLHLRRVGEIWRTLAPTAEVFRIPGSDHRGLLEPPLVDELVKQLLRKLAIE